MHSCRKRVQRATAHWAEEWESVSHLSGKGGVGVCPCSVGFRVPVHSPDVCRGSAAAGQFEDVAACSRQCPLSGRLK